MNATRLSLIALGLASLAACAAPGPPAPPPSDEQPIQASPSTPVERQPEPGLAPPAAQQDDKDHPSQTP
jgi:hypothetical protein